MTTRVFYNCKNVVSVTLDDLAGTNDGTLAGSPTPTANANGYISFSGGNGSTAGNRCRVNVTTESAFQYAYNASFTYAVLFRSSKSDANVHTIIFTGNHDDNGLINISLGVDEFLDCILLSTDGTYKRYTGAASICDGKWHLIVLTYTNNSLTVYLDGNLKALTTNQNITSGNFYSATNCKTVMGARWSRISANYVYDATVDIAYFINYNSTLTAAEAKNLWIHLKDLIGF